ncbi:PIN domain-containing protein [Hymenobacter sp. GOD-10R]|uniref:PIN domain-containing protein n=1 Tax=Hymenobacter sp. GOD-10R TaxID=3093922 RepID=UPI002D776ADF|nr:PIN domain-containing protein [Hymenobacter sp. GOD-10R]WRQ31694.1 PIN domain-containing protein [Hymenobacter sp. GOD-10R]
MSVSAKRVAVLDACVLYPAPLRDLLLNAADFRLYAPKWTARIQDEWTRNLVMNRPELTAEQLQRTAAAMQAAFPEAEVPVYEPLIDSLQLPDPDDRHVLAAAIRAQAEIIVTANLKDFPADVLREYGVEAQHPDAFMTTLLDEQPARVLQAFRQQVSFLRNPPKTAEQVLDTLRRVGLTITVRKLTALLIGSS